MSPRLLSILVGVISLVWASLFTWTEIIDADPDQYSIKSTRVKQDLTSCNGTFQQRQECAERITEAQQQLGFLVWCEKVAIILGPPLVLWGLMGLWSRQLGRSPTAPAPRRVAPAAAGAARNAPRRVRAAETPRPDMPREPPALDPGIDPRPLSPSGPGPRRGPDAPGDAPVFSGGRREPVRRRDR